MTGPDSLVERELTVGQVRTWATEGRLRAVIDACDAPAVWHRAEQLGPARAVSLYAGRREENLPAIAPYVFAVDAALCDWITGDLWTTPWGFFALSEAPIDALREHFANFLVAQLPDGEDAYFRFYDPRVLRTYLPACSAAELAAFFGPVQAIGVTNPATYGITLLSRSAGGASPRPPGPSIVWRRTAADRHQ